MINVREEIEDIKKKIKNGDKDILDEFDRIVKEFKKDNPNDKPNKKKIRIIDIDRPDTVKNNMFEPVSSILNWENISNDDYYDKERDMESKFWIPEEISMSSSNTDWNSGKMSDDDKELFKASIGILASLDSVASKYDKKVSSYIEDSAIYACLIVVAFFEVIHNRSYTYILSSMMGEKEAAEAFEVAKKDPFIIRRNEVIMKHFDNFLNNETPLNFAKGQVALSGLEGISFTNGFIPFYYFKKRGILSGAARIINFINRDEILHTDFQTTTVRDVCQQFPEIEEQGFSDWVYEFLEELVDVECSYTEHHYRNHLDIDTEDVKLYIGWRANIILDQLGLDMIFPAKENPLLWVKAYDPENSGNERTDFFEDDKSDYEKTDSDGWDF